MRAHLGTIAGRALPWLAALGLGALATTALFSKAEADVMDPTIQKTIAIGTGSAPWPTDRGASQRNGRVASLPAFPIRKWKKSVGHSLSAPPIVADGAIVLLVSTSGSGLESSLVELSIKDGQPLRNTKLGDSAAAPPVILANGLRVVVSVRDAIGIDATGAIRFRTPLAGGIASAGKAAVVPLPGGGFTVARAGELVQLDSSGTIEGRVKLDVTLALAARANGDTVAVALNGDLFTWRAGKVPRFVGTFGDKASNISGAVCPLGPIVDGVPGGGTGGKRRERVLCVLGHEMLIEQLDLATGKRSAVFAPPATLSKFRSLPAIGLGGDLAVATSDGTVSGVASTGTSYGPIDVPGAITMITLGKDAGIFMPSSQGEFPPLVADDGAVLFGSTEGVAIAYPTGFVTRAAKCPNVSGAFLTTVAGVASVGPGAIAVACSNGDVELIGENVAPPPTPSATATVPPAPTTSSTASSGPSPTTSVTAVPTIPPP